MFGKAIQECVAKQLFAKKINYSRGIVEIMGKISKGIVEVFPAAPAVTGSVIGVAEWFQRRAQGTFHSLLGLYCLHSVLYSLSLWLWVKRTQVWQSTIVGTSPMSCWHLCIADSASLLNARTMENTFVFALISNQVSWWDLKETCQEWNHCRESPPG